MTKERSTTTVPAKLVSVVALLAMIVGIGSMLGGVAGGIFTYKQAAVEQITTPDDARIAGKPVRGPLTMWAQADIITEHQLSRTEGLRYAEMERLVPALDEDGAPVIGEDGEPVLVPNEARLSWVDATSLTTVLNVGLMAYALALFAVVIGATLAGVGAVLWKLRPQLAG